MAPDSRGDPRRWRVCPGFLAGACPSRHNGGMVALHSPADGLAEIAAVAARLVVEDGLEYAAAKRQAGRQLGVSPRGPWPDNAQLDAAVREHIAVFCADTQPVQLQALRELALHWMDRLAEFQPHVGGAVWHGTATQHSDIYLQLFCDDPKSLEWRLMDLRIDYQPGSVTGWKGELVDVLTVRVRSQELGPVLIHLMAHDRDDVRGALKPDTQGRKPRGDARALRALMAPPGESA
ncbi:hypothetical protein GCM10007935_14300 [Hydrogenophaga electricum]|uniref:Nucleotidyltransferase n=2 Tax=Comamonadaceae TaxID=80864 RepID=A0ABQ6C278_9BURK|nr:hypothetical protein GCM10007935_14300 [Hydrogenophaga electricum]